jgi:hypothetical protein
MGRSGYDFYLSAAAQGVEPTITPGGSGYFSAPQQGLDPRLFEGDRMHPSVRKWVLDTLYGYWATKYRSPKQWSTVWAAGSGISYQWAADRGNGDLDILIGVDFPAFFRANRDYVGMSEAEMGDLFNADFHTELWPKTANWNGFEVTFYVNPNSSDIRNINPYAAYNITDDEWTVRPPKLPADPHTLYPAEYQRAFAAEKEQSEMLVSRYGAARRAADAAIPDSPGWHNSMNALNIVATQARALFDSIHLGRRAAFGSGGSGYGDFYNYRWQAHKQAGTVQALAQLSAVDKEAHKAEQCDIYGRVIGTAAEALTEASLWNTAHRR